MDASEVRYRHVVEMSPDIIWINRDNRIVFMNQAGLRLFGATSPDQMMGKTVIELFHPDSRPLVRQRIGQLLSAPDTRLPFVELRIIRLDGEIRDVEATGASFPDQGKIAILSMLRDTTERKRGERLLSLSERRYRNLVQLIPDAIWITRDAHVVFANPAALRLLGASSEDEVLGLSSFDIIHPDFHDAVRARRQHILAAPGLSNPLIEERIVRRDGSACDVEAVAVSFEDERGLSILVVMRDVTERKRAQAELVESHRNLRFLAAALESIREEERKRVSRDLHDELGQLLSALAMDVAVLKRSAPAGAGDLLALADEMERRVGTIVGAVRRIAKDLRPPMLDTMGLGPALQALASEISERQGPRCEVRGDLGELALPDQVATQVFRMVQEALSNVVKHAGASSASIAIEQNEGELVVRVEDDGRGIAPEDRGRGCGLIGMRERAHNLGGELAVASTPGAGTTVELRLPLVTDA